MATQAQIEANRRNAQKSTGPRTTEGKLTAGQNALRHGLCSNFALIEEEEDEEVQALLHALRDEHQPFGATEEILVYKMAHHFFSQKRAEALMTEHLSTPDDGERNTRELSLLMRYHATADRGFNKCLADLRKLQKERKMCEIGFVSQEGLVEPEAPEPGARDPYEKAEARRESDRVWTDFFKRHGSRDRQSAPDASLGQSEAV